MKELQALVTKFCDKNDMNCSPEFRLLDILSELGEVSKEILKSTEYGKNQFTKTKEFELELGDLLFSLITLANTCDIDLTESLNLVIEKYERRLEKGSSGSEND
jgi:NTP pyrophosphatase (non-canonical NTP hydrolase)